MQKKKAAAERLKSRYKTYDDSKGRGSPEEWARQARAIAALLNGSFAVLDLNEMPATLDELRRARRRAMLNVHPDHGGSEVEAAKINAAFEDLAKTFAAVEAKKK